jgi:hypothetical protein
LVAQAKTCPEALHSLQQMQTSVALAVCGTRKYSTIGAGKAAHDIESVHPQK